MKYLKVVVVAIFMILILGVGNSVFATDTSVVENYIKDIKRYKEYTDTPFTEEVINGYDSQIAFLESLVVIL